MLQLSEQNLKDLQQFINNIPTQYGAPLLQFFGKLSDEQKAQEQSQVKED